MSETPYQAQDAPRVMRSYKKNPYRDFRSKWNIVRVINMTISGGIMLWVVNVPDLYTGLARSTVWLAHAYIYLKFMYDADDLDKTQTIFNFRKDSLLGRHKKIKFKMTDEQMGEICPVEEICVVVPGLVTLIRYRDNNYGVLIRGFPKKPDGDGQQTLLLKVKKFLDGLQEGLFFKSIRYTVSSRNQDTRKGLEQAANEGEHNKARDLHLQDLMSYVDTDERPKSLERFYYFQDIGKCRNLEHAMIQYNSIIPGLKALLKGSMTSYYFLSNPMDIIAYYQEFYEGEEAIL